MRSEYDFVVGCGIAGLSAGLRSAELSQSVLVIEKSPEERAGGHTRLTESVRVPSAETDLSEYGYEFAIPDYTADEFYEDIMSRTNGKANPELARQLVDNAAETIEWLTKQGVVWQMEPLAVGYTVARTFFDGEEVVPYLLGQIEEEGGDLAFETTVKNILFDEDNRVDVVEIVSDTRTTVDCGAVVLAAGGYESSPEKRAKYYGAGYDDMTVRGSRYNTGKAIQNALDAGAQAAGQWSGAHMALIDAESPPVEGGANRVDGYQYGVMLNVNGEWFVDEGQDARAHTYAKFGRLIFEEPDHRAYIVLDARHQELARATGPSDPFVADTLEGLVDQLNLNREQALETLEAYDAACDPDEFDPHTLDGNAAEEPDPPNTNWAVGLMESPYYAYEVTGGITFGFGGVDIIPDAEVVNTRGKPIAGFYAAGNCTGGLFYDNYPGGTGLINAAVYGKTAAEQVDDYLEAQVVESEAR